MPAGAQRMDPHRVQFRGTLTAGEIDALAEDPKIGVLQTSEPMSATVWSLLNDSFFARRPVRGCAPSRRTQLRRRPRPQ
jgi:hypothetical protein